MQIKIAADKNLSKVFTFLTSHNYCSTCLLYGEINLYQTYQYLLLTLQKLDIGGCTKTRWKQIWTDCIWCAAILQSAEVLGVVPLCYKKEDVADGEHFFSVGNEKHYTTYLLQNSSNLVTFWHDMRVFKEREEKIIQILRKVEMLFCKCLVGWVTSKKYFHY